MNGAGRCPSESFHTPRRPRARSARDILCRPTRARVMLSSTKSPRACCTNQPQRPPAFAVSCMIASAIAVARTRCRQRQTVGQPAEWLLQAFRRDRRLALLAPCQSACGWSLCGQPLAAHERVTQDGSKPHRLPRASRRCNLPCFVCPLAPQLALTHTYLYENYSMRKRRNMQQARWRYSPLRNDWGTNRYNIL